MKASGWWDAATALDHCQQPPVGASVVAVGSLLWSHFRDRLGLDADEPRDFQPRYISAVIDGLGRVYMRRLEPMSEW